MIKYIRKPDVYHAEQFRIWNNSADHLGLIYDKINPIFYYLDMGDDTQRVNDGDWIVIDENGNKRVYEDEYFRTKFQRIDMKASEARANADKRLLLKDELPKILNLIKKESEEGRYSLTINSMDYRIRIELEKLGYEVDTEWESEDYHRNRTTGYTIRW